jgi:FMN phosphatase YigB (HAD superfamily)
MIISKAALRMRMRRVGRAVYWRLPRRWRDSVVEFSYRHAGPMFRGMGHYEMWRRRREHGVAARGACGGARLTDLDRVSPLTTQPGSIAVHVHVFYPELVEEFADRLGNIPYPYDLFVSVTDERAVKACEKRFARLPRLSRLHIEIVPNRGRDIAPMLCAFGSVLARYDFIAHLHSKKSLYNKGATDGWRDYLFGSLMGGEDRIRRIFRLLTSGVGMVFPQSYADVPYMASTWLANRAAGMAWCQRLGMARIPKGYFDFPVGSMFWARAEVLRPLFESGITLDDFEPEAGQTDGTLAHTVERLLGVVARDSGQQVAILRDVLQPSWSPWRFEQYLQRDRLAAESAIAAPEIRLVIFDIFDTLLVRPMLDPEQIKAVVARRAGAGIGDAYLQWRVKAENAARAQAGRDVGLPAIIDELGRMAGLDQPSVQRLVDLETSVELASVGPRPDLPALLRHAASCGKRVVLASDMYLPRATIETMLEKFGIDGWHALYVSSDVGMRKDAGILYDHILKQHSVSPDEVLVVGDNERSDFQIPADRGMRTLHVLRAVELARASRRLMPLIERAEQGGELDDDIALGLIVRRFFSQGFHPRFDADAIVPTPDARAIGYMVAGPLCVAFVQWLLARARTDGVARLFFLAREGQFLKQVFDRLTDGASNAPASEYLVVSRRAVNVPAISTLADVLAIAEAYYGPHSLEDYLLERFGLVLSPDELKALFKRGLWSPGRPVMIRNEDISHLEPLLEALLPLILRQGRRERPGLLAYLAQQLLVDDGSCAVVDIGYSGTIQRRLNTLLGGGVHGYYMAADVRTEALSLAFNVRAEGCFHHRSALGDAAPIFVLRSFLAEKLLSSDDAQVIRYLLGDNGVLAPEFRSLSQEELDTREIRTQVRSGAMEFVDDVIAVRDGMLPDFQVPPGIAIALFEAFVDELSPAEEAVLSGLVLDDHYCGRGLVA